MTEDAPAPEAEFRPSDIGPGDQIAGYRLEQQIGHGGMAVVFRAIDERLGRQVALKLLSARLAADASFRQRFIRESRAAAAVDHPNIIPVYDAGDAGGALFIAMRYVQGGDVRSLVKRSGPLAPKRAWSIVAQVSAALDAAHGRNLIHRDVKPANMLLDSIAATSGRGSTDSAVDHVYLSDFGISKQALSAASHLTTTGQFVGTLDYVAPEQIEGGVLDGRTDQYSLACSAYELLAGAPPFRRDQGLALIHAQIYESPPPITALRPELPGAVDGVFARALAKAPASRYPTCAEFAADLGRALGVMPGADTTAGEARIQGGPGVGMRLPAASIADLAAVGAPADQARGPAQIPAQPREPSAPAAVPEPADVPVGWYGDLETVATPPASAVPGSAATPPSKAAPSGTRGTGGAGWPAEPDGTARTSHFAGPDWPVQQQKRPRRSRGLIVGLSVATFAALAAATVLALALVKPSLFGGSGAPSSPPSGSGSPSASSALAAQQATAVNNLLTASSNSLNTLSAGLQDVISCTSPSAGVTQVQQAVSERQSEYNQAMALQTSALTSSATTNTALKSDLVNALHYSLIADQQHLAWAQQQQQQDANSGCVQVSAAPTYTDDTTARTYKNNFLALWNPIAPSYGDPVRNIF